MSNTQRKGLITLLFKKGDSQELKNWRPITLLNCDYKIIAAVLAARVQKVIGTIVNGNQTGYVKGRLAACNVRLTKDVIEYLMKSDKTGAIMLADFTKAFDVLDIEFLKLCLERFNFGESFRKWISILYTDISSSVLINGWTSKGFDVERGIRQGCPLSSLLFILAAEYMANSVRENINVRPMELTGYDFPLKLLQYADDTLFFVQDEKSLNEILNELHSFGEVAGPKINKDKTFLMWLGDTSKRWNLEKYNLMWTDKPIKYLGHYIHSSNDEALETEWEQKLLKLQKVLDSWTKRSLTIFGRVTVLKSLALSQITHLIIVDTIPPKFLKILESKIFKFIWKRKIEKIRRCSLTEDFSKGGIKMLDIQKQLFSFRLKWLGRFFNDTTEMWKIMCSYWFDLLGGINLLLNCNYNISTIDNKNIPIFYKEILQAWEKIRYCTTLKDIDIMNNESIDVLNQIVWHNKHILFNKHSLFYKEWYDSGIVYLGDLVRANGFRSLEYIMSEINFKRRKCTAIFDYVKLKKAIPLVWIDQISDEVLNSYTRKENTFDIPRLIVAKGVKCITELSSKTFYKLIPSRNALTNTCSLYWENKVNFQVDWASVFKHNLVHITENKLREFNLKLLYNLLPVRSNLFKWGLISDDLCPNCKVKENTVHAFVECKLNKRFLTYVERILQGIHQAPTVTISINILHLLKIECKSHYNLILTLAFWSIYKLILERNKTGIDKRSFALKHIFQREISTRIDMQCNRKSNRVIIKNENVLPKELLYF